jgi:hypothetical protein
MLARGAWLARTRACESPLPNPPPAYQGRGKEGKLSPFGLSRGFFGASVIVAVQLFGDGGGFGW